MSNKIPWTVFIDLQCPYSKKCWERLPAIQKQFDSKYDFLFSLTSLLFHPQAFVAQCAATLIRESKGQSAFETFVNACFVHQDSYMNASIGDKRKSEIYAVFCDIPEQAGILDAEFTKEQMMQGIDDWNSAIQPAYAEHKVALGHGVYGTPKHVIGGKLVPETESTWGAQDWQEVLDKL